MTKCQPVNSSSDNGSDGEICGYVAAHSKVKPIPQNFIDAPTVIVSCGLTNFVVSNYATDASRKITNWPGDYRVETRLLNKYLETK